MCVCRHLIETYVRVVFLLQAFKSICDLLIVFSDMLGSINPIYKKLHYVSTAEQQAVLNGFVQHYVFAIQEEGLSSNSAEQPLTVIRNLTIFLFIPLLCRESR